MGIADRFKRDILKHRGRAAVLGVLTVVMAVTGVKAVIDLQPKTVSGSTLALPAVVIPTASLSGEQTKERMIQSQYLWQTLREVRPGAIEASVAFAFDPSRYPAPVMPMALVSPEPRRVEPDPVPVAPAVDPEAIKMQHIKELLRQLVVQSTAVGSGANAQPMAIVNQQLLTIGQEILGFKITAIRAREVEFVYQGSSVVLKMSEGQ